MMACRHPEKDLQLGTTTVKTPFGDGGPGALTLWRYGVSHSETHAKQLAHGTAMSVVKEEAVNTIRLRR